VADDPQKSRAAANESVFREVNERVEELAEGFFGEVEFVCECSRLDCTERLAVPVEVYEAVRASGRRFIVAKGHEQTNVERVVDDRGSWLVVEKTGEAAEAAEARDPRDD
jgi:hypothetical protein